MSTFKIFSVFSLLSCCFLFHFGANGQIKVVPEHSDGQNIFNLLEAKGIFIDDSDDITVETAAKLFAGDIYKVTGKKIPVLDHNRRLPAEMIIAGTIDKNALIQQLIKAKKIKVDSLRGAWERYRIQVVENPFPEVEKALVIAGSDRRGTAYGLLSISALIGVSPWYWWADVPVKERADVVLSVAPFVSDPPSVKYRGIFINDEDWGLLRWAKKTYDPELNDIGPKTYRKVFELLLRLKANYLVPAMHEASGYFNKYPANKRIADTFGIIMGSAHPEPLLFNNASEWDEKTMGPWNYLTNRENIIKVLDQRVKENSPYENVYTVGLRGIHDRAMEGGYPLAERVKLLEQAIQDQRDILKKYIDKPIEAIPQAFTPYKEVLKLYDAGLKLPEDIIIVWPDDNYGYMKRLSSKKEQQRSGGSGVYYHASYLGSPHDYLWLASTPPNLMYEELSKAYKTGADRLWLLNSGDIKSCEAPITQFLAMAWDIDKFNFENTPLFRAKWLSHIYGEKYYEELVDITTTYDHLAFTRKPEFMGWGYEWNTHKHGRERTTVTDFSFANYREAESRLQEYERIANLSLQLMKALPEEQQPSFFELLYYPVKGAELMNKMRLTAQKNRWYAFQQRAKTNILGDKTRRYYDSLQIITKRYNSLLNGKWNHVMSMVQGVTASYFEMPQIDSIDLPAKGEMGLFIQNSKPVRGVNNHYFLPAFNPFTDKRYFVDVYNKGRRPITWTVAKSADWINISQTKGSTRLEDRVWVSVDWDNAPKGKHITAALVFSSSDGDTETVQLSLFNPSDLSVEEVKGLFIEDNGYISIPGAAFHRKVESEAIKMQLVDHLGFEDRSVMLGDPTAGVINPKRSDAPYVEYDFYCFNYGSVDVYTYALPVFPLTSNRDFGFHESSTTGAKYAVSIGEGPIATPTASAPEYSQEWSENVLRNCAINKSVLHINKPGKHTLRIKVADPGMVIQKIVLDFGGMKRSYLGPPSTQVK